MNNYISLENFHNYIKRISNIVSFFNVGDRVYIDTIDEKKEERSFYIVKNVLFNKIIEVFEYGLVNEKTGGTLFTTGDLLKK